MNMERVIKGYFYFLLIVMSMVSLGYNENVGKYYASIFESFENISNEIIEIKDISIVNSMDLQAIVPLNFSYSGDKAFYVGGQEQKDISFEIQNDGVDYFAQSGQDAALAISYLIKTYDKSINLEKLKLSVNGVNINDVRSINISLLGDVIAIGSKVKNAFVFDNLNINFDPKSNTRIDVFVDLGEELRANDRLRLDILNPEDLVFSSKSGKFNISRYYPIKGSYLSVVSSIKKSD